MKNGGGEPSSRSVSDEAQRHSERLKSLWWLVSRHDLDEDERFRAVLRLAADELGMALVVHGEFDGDHTVRMAYDTLGLLPEGAELSVAGTLAQQVFESRAPCLISAQNAHPRFREHPLVSKAGMSTCVGLPIRVGEEILGVLSFLRHAPPAAPFGAMDIAYMESLTGWLGHHLNQSRRRRLLERHALTDPLTALLNRRAAELRLEKEVATSRRHDEGFAVAMLDIDHFKAVNDRFGHAVGDQVLCALAQRIEAGLREEDWVARWGGEEFLVYLRGADAHEAVFVMERLVAEVRSSPVVTDAGAIGITLSVGIGLLGRGEADFRAVIETADSCLYQAKANGRDRIEAREGESVLWPARVIRRALRDERVVMATQLIHDLETGLAVADEALARVRQPDGTLVAAGEFIEAAEGLGLMAEIDRRISRQAMARCAGKLGGGQIGPDFAHFVNLSPQFLARRDLVEEMLNNALGYCQTCGVTFGPIKPVVFEITERQFLRNLDTLEADLKPLLDFGFRLALDDFGSGYSSFLYLARLPISFLKIEGWLVANLKKTRKVAAIVESLAGFARREGITTVAECIEDADTARILRDMGVNLGQGWYFGHPELEENQY